MSIKEKAQHIAVIGNGVVSKQEAPLVMKELEKENSIFYGDIEMNGLVLIEKG